MPRKNIHHSVANIFLFCCCTSVALAQEVISTQGDSFANELVQLDFTLGELAIDNYAATAVSITQGFHQSYVLEIPTAIKPTASEPKILIYPNPASNFLRLTMNDYQGATCLLHDLSGKLISQTKLNGSTTVLDISNLSDGAFRISILDSTNTTTNTYLIIKRR